MERGMKGGMKAWISVKMVHSENLHTDRALLSTVGMCSYGLSGWKEVGSSC